MITKEYELFKDDKKLKFDVITAWEVIEHIKPNDQKSFFNHINDNLNQGGFFCGSISTREEIIEGHSLHQTVWDESIWYKNFPRYFKGYQSRAIPISFY